MDVTNENSPTGLLRDHVKPACSVNRHPSSGDQTTLNETMFVGNSRCFVAGWGLKTEMDNTLTLANTLKYTNVMIVDPNECKDFIDGDHFLQEDGNLEKIICGKV